MLLAIGAVTAAGRLSRCGGEYREATLAHLCPLTTKIRHIPANSRACAEAASAVEHRSRIVAA